MAIDPALVQWDDEPEAPAAVGGGTIDPSMVVWDDEPAGIEIDITGGTPVPAAEFEQPAPDLTAGDFNVPRGGRASRPSLFGASSDFREQAGVGAGTLLLAAARDMFGGREGAAEYLAGKAGGRVGRDERAQPTVVLPGGEVYRTNDPGIDASDIANFAGNALAFAVPAGWAAKVGQARNLGLAGRTALQGAAAGSTDAALQAAVSGGDVDPVRATAAGLGGAGGEVIGTGIAHLARRGVDTFNQLTGRNLTRAREVLREEGVEQTPQAVQAMASRVPELRAGANRNALVGAERFGFQYTQGQRATDPRQQFELLSREELLRQSPAGGQVLRDAQARNVEQLENALTGMTSRLGGGQQPTPAGLADGAATRLRGQADELDQRISDAYQAAGQGSRTAVSVDAVAGLPRMLRTAVADFAPNPDTTPVAARTLSQIETATAALLRREEGEAGVAGVTLKALETQRRILNNNINAATNNADRAAMVKIKREFDSWMDEAVDTALISGDPGALQAMKDARALRAEFGRRFEGSSESDRFIAGLLDGSRTPEELVNIALGASQVSKAGGARFIERLRAAADGDPGVVGNLRAAHFLRLTRGNNGEPLAMGQIVRNIRQTEYSNASIVKALYEPAEWTEIRRLASALEPLVAKGDFARTSGTSERMARMLFQRMGGGLPIVGDMVRGLGEGMNVIQAQRALREPLRLPARSGRAAPAAGAALVDEAAR